MTIEGELRSVIVATGVVGERVWHGRPAEREVLPYVTYFGPVSMVPGLRGDAQTMSRRREVQVDLWEDRGVPVEQVDAAFDTLVSALDGARLDGTFRCRVTQARELPDPEVIHHSMSVVVDHLT
jgi:hypothetical protein